MANYRYTTKIIPHTQIVNSYNCPLFTLFRIWILTVTFEIQIQPTPTTTNHDQMIVLRQC